MISFGSTMSTLSLDDVVKAVKRARSEQLVRRCVTPHGAAVSTWVEVAHVTYAGDARVVRGRDVSFDRAAHAVVVHGVEQSSSKDVAIPAEGRVVSVRVAY